MQLGAALHDLKAFSGLGFSGYGPPSILERPCAIRLHVLVLERPCAIRSGPSTILRLFRVSGSGVRVLPRF